MKITKKINSDAIYLGALIAMAYMTAYTIPMMIGIFMENGISGEAAGVLASLEIFSISLSAIILAGFIHHLDLKKLAASCMLVCILTQAASILYTEYTALLFIRGLAGLACGGLLAIANYIIARNTKASTLYGWSFAAASTILALTLVVAPFTYSTDNSTGFFVFIGLIYALGLFALAFIPREESSQIENPEQKLTFNKQHFRLLIPYFISMTIIFTYDGGVWSSSEIIGSDNGLEREDVGILLGLSTILGAFGATISAFSVEKIGIPRSTFIGVTLNAIALTAVATSSEAYVYSIGVLLYGLIFMYTLPLFLVIGAEIDTSGRISIIANAYTMVAYSLGPMLFGLIGHHYIFELGVTALILIMLCAAAMSRVAYKVAPTSSSLVQ